MSPGSACDQLTDTPAARCEPESPGVWYPAMPSTYAVRPEQSKPISLPQLLFAPPPRAQPLFGPAPDPPPPQTYGRPRAEKPAARPAATAAFGAVIFCPASADETNWLLGTVTVVPVARTAAVADVDVPPPVEPKYLRKR